MSDSIIAIDKNKHKNTRVMQDPSYAHSKEQHICLLQAHEIVSASIHYPCVFIKDGETGQFLCVALMGLKPNENLFYSSSAWLAAYVPASIRAYPFMLAPLTGAVCIETESKLLNDSVGERLFDDDGNTTDYLNDVKKLLSTFVAQSTETSAFIEFLNRKNILSPLSLTVKDSEAEGGEVQLNGIYSIDSEKLHTLPDAEYIDLKNRHYILPIYAQIISLNCVSNLIQKKQNKK